MKKDNLQITVDEWNDLGKVREFPGGATRDLAEGKLAYTRFLSPRVLTRYCEYLEKHRDTAAGRREPDNYKAGIPKDVYMESMGRHFWEVWTAHEGGEQVSEDALCALLFNVMGYLYEELRQ